MAQALLKDHQIPHMMTVEHPKMTIQISSAGTEVVAVLTGELTLNTMDSYLPAFVELSVQGWNDVVLDMTGVSSLDTAGAGLLLALRDRLATQGLELRLSCLAMAMTIDTLPGEYQTIH
jgi:anti-anti-sigma factor